MKEELSSPRVLDVSFKTTELHIEVDNLYEALMDRERAECLTCIDLMKDKLNQIKRDVTNGEIIQ